MLKDNVLKLLEGKDEPTTRSELMTALGTDDRIIRQAIHDLRKEGNPIVSHSDGKGYTLTSDPYEIKSLIAENSSRIHSLAKVNSGLMKALEVAQGQLGYL